MSRTTPPPRLDITEVFPELVPLRRTATRLHPRPGSPSPGESSIGGPLLWPADEPWPYCARAHQAFGVPPLTLAGVARLRALRAARWERQGAEFTDAERAECEQISKGVAVPQAPIALLPVAQLYVADVPDLVGQGPAGADVLQVLWCPFDHFEDREYQPKTVLRWRDSAPITDVLADPPQPAAVMLDDYVPEPCVLDPEQVVEYPSIHALDREVQERISAWDTGDGDDDDEAHLYFYELSVAPGFKVGGWEPWNSTDPWPMQCQVCAGPVRPLLTVGTVETYGEGERWTALEDREMEANPLPAHRHRNPLAPTQLQLGRGYDMQVYVCCSDVTHPTIDCLL